MACLGVPVPWVIHDPAAVRRRCRRTSAGNGRHDGDDQGEIADGDTERLERTIQRQEKTSNAKTGRSNGKTPGSASWKMRTTGATFTEALLAASYHLSTPEQAVITAGAGPGGALIAAARDHYKEKKDD
jgi:hypothetical protein